MKHKGPHQYKRKELGEKTIFKCILPSCTHYVWKELAEGMECICYRCKKIFVLRPLHLTLVKPHCFCKREQTKPEIVETVDDILSKFGVR